MRVLVPLRAFLVLLSHLAPGASFAQDSSGCASHQKALWLADDAGDETAVAAAQAQLHEAFLPGSCHKSSSIRSHGSSVFRMTCAGDNRGIFKPDRLRFWHASTWFGGNTAVADARKEVAAYRIDRFFGFGLVPYTIPYHEGVTPGSLQVALPEFSYEASFKLQEGDTKALVTYNERAVKNWLPLMIFDYLTANSDRHAGNVLYWPEQDRLVAIDHGLTFSEEGFVKRVRLDGCTLQVGDDQARSYLTFSQLSMSLAQASLPAKLHTRLLEAKPDDFHAELSSLLNSRSRRAFWQRLEALRACLP